MSPMSHTDAGRFNSAATLASLVDEAVSTPVCEGTSGPEDEATHATDHWPPRPVSSARLALSRNAHPRPFNDPSNYLG
jgi:hypothetical protein